MMKDYSTYDSIDFAQDEDFVKWVKYPGQFPSIDLFWSSWLKEHAHKNKEVEMAKRFIQAVVEEGIDMPPAAVQEKVWKKIQNSIQAERQASKVVVFWKPAYKIAAAILLIVGVSFVVWRFSAGIKIQNEQISSTRFNLIEETNEGVSPKTIVLSDGTSIALQPHSAIQYPSVFSKDVREVRLRGEAFFEVTKNPDRPFLVHADKIVAKVLGTSFVIRVFNDESDVLVQVKTGRVSVYKESQAGKMNGSKTLEGIILVPNQQIVYSRTESKMVKSSVENSPLMMAAVKQKFIFQDTPLEEVFSSIQQVYGVKIIYTKESISNCSLNASLDDMPLYDKMRLICKGLNASYQVSGSDIIFSGKGCN